ncbi:MAG: hypothetical protein KVP17_002801 [Porospora cf. gigantea B]|uniref:uncharacterized protein n=1 Tax=Porospora cf. gigantea B TaxID=2853592 RepID=UPI003571E48B|nr:MAG: hypothetical protein KVP17_002801 [Porospora cf. gigantea B]
MGRGEKPKSDVKTQYVNSPKKPGKKADRDIKDHMKGARFRFLNERLYTATSDHAFDEFGHDKAFFEEYHSGFRLQAGEWPLNPLKMISKWLRNQTGPLLVADMGCGDADLQAELQDIHQVYSFDLVSTRPEVIAANIKDVPLEDASVDVVVFSLALMGTDWPAFLSEARRTMKVGGTLVIAEIVSRLNTGNKFIAAVESLGFKRTTEQIINDYFVIWRFNKEAAKPRAVQIDSGLLTACKYKIR